MSSRKGTDQALTWLKSKMAEGDTLDAINAEICYNVILDLQKKRRVIGALYHRVYNAKKRREEDEALESFYESMAEKYIPVEVDIPEEWR